MEYKRLTRRNIDGTTWVKCASCDIQDKCDFTKESCCNELQDRLAELEDKIEQGTLIELPCKVGDTVYCIDGFCDDSFDIVERVVRSFVLYEEKSYFTAGKKLGDCSWYTRTYDIKTFGTTVFLTREEAEKRLKEIQNG